MDKDEGQYKTIYGMTLYTNVISEFDERTLFFIYNPVRPDWNEVYDEWTKFARAMKRRGYKDGWHDECIASNVEKD